MPDFFSNEGQNDDDGGSSVRTTHTAETTDRQLVPGFALVFVILLYLMFWVANGEMMQGISNGRISPKPYDNPPFLAWYAYCSFVLCWIPVLIYTRCSLKMNTGKYLREVWATEIGIKRMFLYCWGMMYILICLNILWVVGLNGVSVATSNAVYQLQTVVTVILSVVLFGTKLHRAEVYGVVLSLAGVAMIVVPPLFEGKPDGATPASGSPLFGILATFLSAIIWAVYQVAWRVIARQRGLAETETQLRGLMDTLTTLAVMGVINVLLGWPVLVLLDVCGIESFEWPSRNLWPILTVNSLIELSFDATCVIAIYLTSAVITAVTAPLTIPLSFLWDHLQYGTPLLVSNWSWIGSILVIIGVAWMELKCGVAEGGDMRCSCCFKASQETQPIWDSTIDPEHQNLEQDIDE